MSELANYSPQQDAPNFDRITIPQDCAGLRLDQVLARLYPAHSRSRLQGWLKSGFVRLDGGARDAKHKVWGGECLEVAQPPTQEQTSDRPEDIPLAVVFEDEDILVIDKPVGLVVHPGSGNWDGTLLNALLHHVPALATIPRAGIVHRLDKDTSGLMVVAKSLEAQTDLVRQLQARTVRRHYLALVHGQPPAADSVDAPIARHPTLRVRMAVVAGGRPAVTHFTVRERFGACALLECRLETGRTHQIRVHMASLGHPLIGDQTYGRRRQLDPLLAAFPRQALHAFRLGLNHPRGGACAWEAPLPADMLALLEALRETAGQVRS